MKEQTTPGDEGEPNSRLPDIQVPDDRSPAEGAHRPRPTLILTPRLLDTSAGRGCTDLALHLDRERFEPVVCCYHGWGPLARELEKAGVPIFPLKRRRGVDPSFVFALAREIRSRRIEVVHSLNARKAYVVGVLAGILGGASSAVATFHHPPVASSRRLNWIGRLCGEAVGSVVASSEAVAEELLRQRWVPPGKPRVVAPGIALERFADPGRRVPARRLWQIPDDALVVGAVIESKSFGAVRLLREAFEILAAKSPRVHLLVSGVTGSAERVRTLGPYTDSPAFYGASDVMCIPFASRHVPPALLDGLAAGKPVVASQPQDAGAWVPRGPWAFARVSSAGPAALAEELFDALVERKPVEAVAREARECLREEYSIGRHVARIQALYDKP